MHAKTLTYKSTWELGIEALSRAVRLANLKMGAFGPFRPILLPLMPGAEFPTIFMGGNSMLGEASETSDADLEVPSQP
jgi:hypothetical protein